MPPEANSYRLLLPNFRYNTLLMAVARQLAALKKAVKGLVVVTPELEDISQALLQGKVREQRGKSRTVHVAVVYYRSPRR